jgi:hypothetical protein
MSEKEWEKFFELLDKIVGLEGKSYQEKAAEVRERADLEAARTSLEEFLGWFED